MKSHLTQVFVHSSRREGNGSARVQELAVDVLAFLEPPQEITLRTVALVALAPAYAPSLGARAVAVASRAAHPDSAAPGDPASAAGAGAAYHRWVGGKCHLLKYAFWDIAFSRGLHSQMELI